MDGTHISITNPTNSRGRFINRKRHADIIFFIEADANFKIRYFYSGIFRSSHDLTVFKLSKFKEWCDIIFIDTMLNYHILGDAAYPNFDYIKKPFKDILNDYQPEYIDLLIPQRVIFERTIGLFNGKFQRFRHEIKNGENKFTSKIVYAAITIYNLTINDRLNNTQDQLINEIINEEITNQ
ncbi:hypothetical protein A0H76_2913 [Hepatospora eriocheir]|uniref:DDE Tnp4 domain-containing protein n=1 Tax=Hepatospora eriocheir TaxID=1081669 RepID=A0A1X0Q5M1_9MICR|nr:hypothetical protein A0H76_2913 [Hepatospora eriocheir]